jgi:Protein of unknown function (DUF1264)
MDGSKLALLSLFAFAAACGGGDNSQSRVPTPGRNETPTTKTLEAGAELLQSKAPLAALDAYLDGFHFRNGDIHAQMEAHHYCGHLNEDVIQCAIFDGNGTAAKLVGVEYIVSAALFAALPADEKTLWHSHVHEVRSGQLIAPGLPASAEHALMQKIARTYGKTWHMWHTDRQDPLPLGAPTLMMGFTADGQADEDKLTARDRRFGVSGAEKRQQRANIDYPPVDPNADAWQKGVVVQTRLDRR